MGIAHFTYQFLMLLLGCKRNQKRGLIMSLSPSTIVLIAVITTGYLAAVSLGTWAYFANEKE